jgi:hypothetical protein
MVFFLGRIWNGDSRKVFVMSIAEGKVVSILGEKSDPGARTLFERADTVKEMRKRAVELITLAVEDANSSVQRPEDHWPIPSEVIEILWCDWQNVNGLEISSIVADCVAENGEYIAYTVNTNQYTGMGDWDKLPTRQVYVDQIPCALLNMVGDYQRNGLWRWKGALWEYVEHGFTAKRCEESVRKTRYKNVTRIIVSYGGEKFTCSPEIECEPGDIHLTGTGLVLKGHTAINKIYNATCKTFDYALPQPWVDENYLDKGLPMPRGVWCYPEHGSCFGEFLSYDEAISLLVDGIRGVVHLYQMEV